MTEKKDRLSQKNQADTAQNEAPRKGALRRIWRGTTRTLKWTTIIVSISALTLIVAAAYIEVETSQYQRHYFEELAHDVDYTVVPVNEGKELDLETIHQTAVGPWNKRRGYTRARDIATSVTTSGYDLVGRAKPNEAYLDLEARGFNPPVEEKTQAGMQLLDTRQEPLRVRQTPARIWNSFDDVPTEIAETLAFVENRELLEPAHPSQNPVIEWDRVARAGGLYALEQLGADVDVPGGSTLATQLEKFRHSSDGTTDGVVDKYRQMMSASMRVYAEDADTRDDREAILLRYLNDVPLSSQAPHGPVFGLKDGLWAYFGIDQNTLERAFSTDAELALKGEVYAAALGLIISQRAPTTLLKKAPERLDELVRINLGELERHHIITPALAEATRAALPLTPLDASPTQSKPSITRRKAVDALEAHLASAVGVERLYELEHHDITAHTTLDQRAQRIAEDYLLESMYDTDFLREHGFYRGSSLLDEDQDPDAIEYSFTVYESTPQGNLLRVQVDTLDKPFNFNEQARLDLGSTAKLRTLITYLNLVEALYHEHKDKTRGELWNVDSERGDGLEVWVRRQLIYNRGITLEEILEHALEKRYSASPYRRYRTGGGMHTFHNYSKHSNGRRYSVQDGLAHSVNLVSINVMKDVVDHYRWILADSSIIEDRDNPLRQVYLARWVRQDSEVFLDKFINKYKNLDKKDILPTVYKEEGNENLAALTITYRSITGETAPSQQFKDYIVATVPKDKHDELPQNDEAWQELFEEHDATKFDWNERGYVASTHPLELWVAHMRYTQPSLTREQLLAQSHTAVDEAYSWLYKNSDSRRAHDKIYMELEEDAFKVILSDWQKVGYPFETLVPSLGTALGSSGDRPEALATLMGIILNEGVWVEPRRFHSIDFAKDTPYELRFEAQAPERKRVLSPEVAAAARHAIERVVERGTARRASRAYMVPGPDGDLVRDRTVRIGGKTGTGDHRQKSFDRWGNVIEETFVSRSATFSFLKDSRYFGVITIHVEGEQAGDYDFTSSMATEIFRQLFPTITETLDTIPEQKLEQEAHHDPVPPSVHAFVLQSAAL